MTDDGLSEWAMDRLNHKKWSSDPSKPPERIDLVRCVNYDVAHGICVTVLGAKAIQGELTQCFILSQALHYSLPSMPSKVLC